MTNATATIDKNPPIASWTSNVRPRGPKVRSAPKPSETPTGDGDAYPDHGQVTHPTGLDEIGDEYDDHEGCFKSFAQADEVIREHIYRFPSEGRPHP